MVVRLNNGTYGNISNPTLRPAVVSQFSVVSCRLSGGNLRFANGTEITAVWDDLCLARGCGIRESGRRKTFRSLPMAQEAKKSVAQG